MIGAIVLVKQVPDITQVPVDAFDQKTGTLRRGRLEPILNPLDRQALAWARTAVKEGEIWALSMGPDNARAVLIESIALGADAGILLTDRAFAGSDTYATASVLTSAIKKIKMDFECHPNLQIIAGYQSTDGDTAQVPAQLAQKLALPFLQNPVAELPAQPSLVSVEQFEEPVFPSISRHATAFSHIREWDASDLPDAGGGVSGSKTQVVKVAPAVPSNRVPKALTSVAELSDLINAARSPRQAEETAWECPAHRIDGKVVVVASHEKEAHELIGRACALYENVVWFKISDEVGLAENCTKICESLSVSLPDVVLFSATPVGRGLAPLIAAELHCGLTADCTDLQIDEKGRLLQIRPALGGNIMATIRTINSTIQMATVRPGVFPCPAQMDSLTFDEQCVTSGSSLNPISQAEPLILSGGNGLGSSAQFDALRGLVGTIPEATLGASRSAVERGWAAHTDQVGQTGRNVAAQLYVAFGISGAIQHRVGIENVKTVVAVNTDPNAPFMEDCDYYLIADANAVIAMLTEEVTG